jgi:hypothetical protein
LENLLFISATEKVALLIGNDTYADLSGLNTPRSDVATIASILKDIGFKVIALHNLTLNEMRNAVHEFCQLLPQEGYGKTSFYYLIITSSLSSPWICFLVFCAGGIMSLFSVRETRKLFMFQRF